MVIGLLVSLLLFLAVCIGIIMPCFCRRESANMERAASARTARRMEEMEAHPEIDYVAILARKRPELASLLAELTHGVDRPMTDIEELTARWTPTINDP